MELINKDKRDGYIYDVVIKQRDTNFWKDTAGTSSATGNKLRLNAASIASYIQHIFADVEIGLNIPTTPSTGEAKHWGLRSPATDTQGAAYFEIAGAVFTAVTRDSAGTAETTTLTWSSYENAETKYRIRWEPDQVIFYINGTIVATHNTRVPQNALPLRIVNADSDNVDMGYVKVTRAASIV